MELSKEDQIWKRAARNGGSSPRKGDTALASLLRVHGMIKSGGIERALDSLPQQQYKAGVNGFRYFGLLGAAIVLEQARLKRISKNIDIEQLNENYNGLVPGDDALFRALEIKLLASPEDFCPLET